MEYRIKSVQNAALWTRLRFSGGAIKEERDNRKPSGDFTQSQPGQSQLPYTHTYLSVFGFKKLEYRMKIVQNPALWTRLRFSGGAIKEERETTGNPQVILPRRSPVEAETTAHTHRTHSQWLKLVP